MWKSTSLPSRATSPTPTTWDSETAKPSPPSPPRVVRGTACQSATMIARCYSACRMHCRPQGSMAGPRAWMFWNACCANRSPPASRWHQISRPEIPENCPLIASRWGSRCAAADL
ncbi:hypothetical protein ABW45_12380 [Stenotrophomonas maltophilia]|nr:hypothetical protein ABW45_12380 [Stenotrophomonas maltophilia]